VTGFQRGHNGGAHPTVQWYSVGPNGNMELRWGCVMSPARRDPVEGGKGIAREDMVVTVFLPQV